jgi:hypothetical protein
LFFLPRPEKEVGGAQNDYCQCVNAGRNVD